MIVKAQGLPTFDKNSCWQAGKLVVPRPMLPTRCKDIAVLLIEPSAADVLDINTCSEYQTAGVEAELGSHLARVSLRVAKKVSFREFWCTPMLWMES